jgi:hypothetical protein
MQSTRNIHQLLLLAWAVSLLLLSCKEQPAASEVDIRGIYGNPKAFWEKGMRLDSLGVNAIFVHSGSISGEMMEQARAEGLRVFAEFPTLNGKNYVDSHPEAWPLNEQGEKAEAASWFMGVCPTEPGFRAYRKQLLRELLQQYNLDGVWLDYVHWHAQFEEPEPILPETCFCDHCLGAFSNHTGISLPEGPTETKAQFILENQEESWRDWRCKVILDWVTEMKAIVNELRPDALLGLYHCPWNDQEFDGARRRILGLDYDLLRKEVDVFSPMVYHGRMGREPEWVKENLEWFSERAGIENTGSPKLWPIVQAYNDPDSISAAEFGEVLEYGLAGKSSGVMMFTTYAVAAEPEKVETMKNLYQELEK